MKSIHLTTIATALILSSATAHADVSISNRATKNITCDAGACVPDGPKAVLNVNDLAALLANSDTTVFTGNGAVSIHVKTPLNWSSTHKLTLNAYGSVYFEAPVTAEGTSAVSLVTNTQGQGGQVYFRPGGSLSFWDTNSQLTINGTAYTLFTDLTVLADDIAANPSGNFALAQDFDAFVDGIFPHSVVTKKFKGSLEGLGHTIDRLSIDDGSQKEDQLVGLFSWLDTGSRVANLHLTNASVEAFSATTAGLAAVALGTIDHVWVGGSITVTTPSYAAGIAAENGGAITKVSSAVTISGGACGGIVAFNDGGVISLSTASGSIQCESAGGLVAFNQGSISLSSASASVASDYEYGGAGGLVGAHYGGTIDQSFATGSVSHLKSDGRPSPPKRVSVLAGGLVGLTEAPITNSYATGSVSAFFSGKGRYAAGGLIGYSDLISGTITTGYSTGTVGARSRSYVGGSIGYDANAAGANSWIYWDLDTSGVPDASKGAGNIAFDPGLKGLTDQHLKQSLPKGFDPKIWGQSPSINNGYPYLLANPPPK